MLVVHQYLEILWSNGGWFPNNYSDSWWVLFTSENFANVQIRDYGFSVFDLVNSVKYKLGHIIGCVRAGGKH